MATVFVILLDNALVERTFFAGAGFPHQTKRFTLGHLA